MKGKKKHDENILHEMSYPSHLEWNCRIWTLKKGSLLDCGTKTYSVEEVIRNPTPGKMPDLKVKLHEDNS